MKKNVKIVLFFEIIHFRLNFIIYKSIRFDFHQKKWIFIRKNPFFLLIYKFFTNLKSEAKILKVKKNQIFVENDEKMKIFKNRRPIFN